MKNHVMKRLLLFIAILTTLTAQAILAQAATIKTQAGTLQIDRMAGGFDTPWAFGFLPDGAILVTEREGRLWIVKGGQKHQVKGLPQIAVTGQGGLLDVLIPRDFAKTRQVYLTHAKPQSGGVGTALSMGRLSDDGRELIGTRTLFEIAPGSSGGRHFGSRLVEGRDGLIYMSIGDRGDRPSAQDLGRHNGAILRLTRDGKPAAGNPFSGTKGALPEIYSYGHRNPQGIAMDAQGRIWANEHGARGGDEVNLIRKGANYGWPVIAYGRHYSGRKIGEGSAKPGMEQPKYYWDPSIAPSGMTFYDGSVSGWRGNAFAGSLKFDYIARLSGSPLREVEQIKSSETKRVRDIRTGPDGALWFLSEDRGALYRIAQ